MIYNENMKYYTTGQFAKKAGTTERTIRYYDKIGLLKPTRVLSNGYRQYTNYDLIKLQRIIVLQTLGFTLEDIFPLVVEEGSMDDNFKTSLSMQIGVVNQKIEYFITLKKALLRMEKLVQHNHLPWDQIREIITLSKNEDTVIEQYQSIRQLHKKIDFHTRFSNNPIPWFLWLYQHMEVVKANKLLEIGCGNGELWRYNTMNLRNREFFLTDYNKSMLEEAKLINGNDFNYLSMDGQDITFKDEYFDQIIANHVLFYFSSINKGLFEIWRVLKKDGYLYASTYGKDHMKEIRILLKEYDKHIKLHDNICFTIENGEQLLSEQFRNISFTPYNDFLLVDDVDALVDYIMLCSGNQKEIIGKDIQKFKQFVQGKMKNNGHIKITKNVGLYICQK